MALAIVVSAGVLLVGWLKARTWSQLHVLEQEFAAIETEGFYLGVNVRGVVWQLNGALLRFQLSRDEAERERFVAESQRLGRLIQNSQPHLTTELERNLAGQIEKAYGEYLAATASLLEPRSRAIRKDTSAHVHDEILQTSAPLLDLSEKLVSAQHAALTGFFRESEKAMSSLQSLSHISVVAIVGLLAGLTALLYRSAIAPLRLQLSQTRAVMERQEKLASLGVLAAGVAHEIRNPLTAIKFRLFSLKKSLPDGYAEQEDMGVIKSEIDRLEKIVKDFLLFARPSEPELTNIAAGEIVNHVHNLLKGQLEKQGIMLKLEDSASGLLRVDKNQIEQVLINLAQNAADSIETDGQITLRAHAAVAKLSTDGPVPVIIFQIADTGRGIPAEVQDRIFDPFFSTKEAGTGLGLPIAARIVERHGGFIQYQSQAGSGTVFSVVLPRFVNNGSEDTHH